jgi:hypothetical protein
MTRQDAALTSLADMLLRCSLFEEPVAKKCGVSVVATGFCMLCMPSEDVCVCVLLRKDEAK